MHMNKARKIFAAVLATALVLLNVVTFKSVSVRADSDPDPITTFVTSLYSDCLGRSPDPSGLNDWVSKLRSHAISGKDCARGFFYSPEFASKASSMSEAGLIEIFYKVFLNRSSDDQGRSYWASQIAGPADDITTLFNGFSDSVEFGVKCANYGIVSNITADGWETYYIRFADGFMQVEAQFDDPSGHIAEINSYRASCGVPALRGVTDLNSPEYRYARLRAVESAVVFSHTRPDGTMCDSGMPYDTWDVAFGENIASGSVGVFNTRIINGFINSPGHAANMRSTTYTWVSVASCRVRAPGGGQIGQSTVQNFYGEW